MSEQELMNAAQPTDDDLQALIDEGGYGTGGSVEGDDETYGVIEIDVTDAVNPFDPAPHGNYRLRILKYQPTAAKSSGSPMISCELEIIAVHPQPPVRDPEQQLGKRVFQNMVIKGDGERFGKFMHQQITLAVGLPTSGGPAKAYVGREFDAELHVDPGNNQQRPQNRIGNVYKIQ
jgi:hypothetical protein